MISTENSGWGQGFSGGRIIVPGTERQLGAFGLFRPSPSPGQATGEGQARGQTSWQAAVKHAEGGVLWISLGQLLEQNIPEPELTGVAATHETWVLDADVPGKVSGSGPLAKRFVEVARVLEQCDVTVFLVSASPLPLDPANPFSALALVESSEELPVEGIHGS